MLVPSFNLILGLNCNLINLIKPFVIRVLQKPLGMKGCGSAVLNAISGVGQLMLASGESVVVVVAGREE
jgi:hypothetical protein